MLGTGILSLLINSSEKDSRSPQIHAKAMSVDEFFAETDFSLMIPEYQRPYVWDQNNLAALLTDYEDYLGNLSSAANKDNPGFYLGSLLLYKKKGNTLSIIDGQQRITTMLLIDYLANNTNSVLSQKADWLTLTYRSPLSKKNIALNRDYLLDTQSR